MLPEKVGSQEMSWGAGLKLPMFKAEISLCSACGSGLEGELPSSSGCIGQLGPHFIPNTLSSTSLSPSTHLPL